jgi:hypothetical protein
MNETGGGAPNQKRKKKNLEEAIIKCVGRKSILSD